MFPIHPKHEPKPSEAIMFFFIIIGLISYLIIGKGATPHVPILLGIFLLLAYGMLKKIRFTVLQEAMMEGAKVGMGAVFLFMLIGILIGSWIISGTIPALIESGFYIMGTGSWFYALVFTITAVIGISLGSSLTTVATIGVAFIGMADALDASVAISAGAIVSGAFFGDKMSPMSDTTNLASTVVGVDLFQHIKHISLTTIPAFIIAFIGFVLLSPKQATISPETISMYQTALQETNLLHWSSWIPLLLLVVTAIMRIPAFVAMGANIIVSSLLAYWKSGFDIQTIGSVWFDGYKAETSFMPVNELLTKGGINSMLFTISLVILALGFGGLLFVTGIIPSILYSLQEKLRKARAIVASTALTAIGLNMLVGEQYLAIMLTGETYKPVYEKVGLPKKVLSRTLEDAGTVINPLVPWSVCGVFIANVLGVDVLDYLPFAFFCLLCPVITILFGGRKAPGT